MKVSKDAFFFKKNVSAKKNQKNGDKNIVYSWLKTHFYLLWIGVNTPP